jgi:hypothetical protein
MVEKTTNFNRDFKKILLEDKNSRKGTGGTRNTSKTNKNRLKDRNI